MPILSLLLLLAVFGFVLWLIVTYIPMPDPIKKIIIVIAVVFLIIWLLNATGLLDSVNTPIRFHR